MTTPTGWLCPSCGKAHGPTVQTCTAETAARQAFHYCGGTITEGTFDDAAAGRRAAAKPTEPPPYEFANGATFEIREAELAKRPIWREWARRATTFFSLVAEALVNFIIPPHYSREELDSWSPRPPKASRRAKALSELAENDAPLHLTSPAAPSSPAFSLLL